MPARRFQAQATRPFSTRPLSAPTARTRSSQARPQKKIGTDPSGPMEAATQEWIARSGGPLQRRSVVGSGGPPLSSKWVLQEEARMRRPRTIAAVTPKLEPPVALKSGPWISPGQFIQAESPEPAPASPPVSRPRSASLAPSTCRNSSTAPADPVSCISRWLSKLDRIAKDNSEADRTDIAGVWYYHQGMIGQFTIAKQDGGDLKYTERRAEGLVEGVLTQMRSEATHWWVAESPIGTIRLRFRNGELLSNFRQSGETEWGPDVLAHTNQARVALELISERPQSAFNNHAASSPNSRSASPKPSRPQTARDSFRGNTNEIPIRRPAGFQVAVDETMNTPAYDPGSLPYVVGFTRLVSPWDQTWCDETAYPQLMFAEPTEPQPQNPAYGATAAKLVRLMPPQVNRMVPRFVRQPRWAGRGVKARVDDETQYPTGDLLSCHRLLDQDSAPIDIESGSNRRERAAKRREQDATIVREKKLVISRSRTMKEVSPDDSYAEIGLDGVLLSPKHLKLQETLKLSQAQISKLATDFQIDGMEQLFRLCTDDSGDGIANQMFARLYSGDAKNNVDDADGSNAESPMTAVRGKIEGSAQAESLFSRQRAPSPGGGTPPLSPTTSRRDRRHNTRVHTSSTSESGRQRRRKRRNTMTSSGSESSDAGRVPYRPAPTSQQPPCRNSFGRDDEDNDEEDWTSGESEECIEKHEDNSAMRAKMDTSKRIEDAALKLVFSTDMLYTQESPCNPEGSAVSKKHVELCRSICSAVEAPLISAPRKEQPTRRPDNYKGSGSCAVSHGQQQQRNSRQGAQGQEARAFQALADRKRGVSTKIQEGGQASWDRQSSPNLQFDGRAYTEEALALALGKAMEGQGDYEVVLAGGKKAELHERQEESKQATSGEAELQERQKSKEATRTDSKEAADSGILLSSNRWKGRKVELDGIWTTGRGTLVTISDLLITFADGFEIVSRDNKVTLVGGRTAVLTKISSAKFDYMISLDGKAYYALHKEGQLVWNYGDIWKLQARFKARRSSVEESEEESEEEQGLGYDPAAELEPGSPVSPHRRRAIRYYTGAGPSR